MPGDKGTQERGAMPFPGSKEGHGVRFVRYFNAMGRNWRVGVGECYNPMHT